MLLNDQWVIEEIRKEIKMLLKFNENENMAYQKLWDVGRAVVRGKCIAVSEYIKNIERSQQKT
jgi:hypothetical protein